MFIGHPRHGAIWCSVGRARLSIVLVNFVTLIVCIPNFVTMTLKNDNFTDVGANSSSNQVQLVWNVVFKQETGLDVFIQSFNFWIQVSVTYTMAAGTVNLSPRLYSYVSVTAVVNGNNVGLCQAGSSALARETDIRRVVIFFSVFSSKVVHVCGMCRAQALFVRLVPCIGLTVLSLLLVQTMRQAEERRQNLRGKSSAVTKAGKDGGGGGGSDRKTNRTTMMLLLVVVLFLVTELPQGVINLLSGLLPGFVDEIYMALGDLLDILALINNGINFILYCSMSKQFRDTFVSVFRLDALSRQCAARCRCCKPSAANFEDRTPMTAPTAVIGGNDQYVLMTQT